jgi:hypothetical protein
MMTGSGNKSSKKHESWTVEEFERLEVKKRFSFHPATQATGPKHDDIRLKYRTIALWVLGNIPKSREQSLALTALQEAMMWSNAAVAIHTEPEPLSPGSRDEA